MNKFLIFFILLFSSSFVYACTPPTAPSSCEQLYEQWNGSPAGTCASRPDMQQYYTDAYAAAYAAQLAAYEACMKPPPPDCPINTTRSTDGSNVCIPDTCTYTAADGLRCPSDGFPCPSGYMDDPSKPISIPHFCIPIPQCTFPAVYDTVLNFCKPPDTPNCSGAEVYIVDGNLCQCAPPNFRNDETLCVPPPSCTLPSVLRADGKGCEVPCVPPKVLDVATNVCTTPPPPVCVPPQVLDVATNVCISPPPPSGTGTGGTGTGGTGTGGTGTGGTGTTGTGTGGTGTTTTGCLAGDACDQTLIRKSTSDTAKSTAEISKNTFDTAKSTAEISKNTLEANGFLKTISEFKICPVGSTATYCALFGDALPDQPIQTKEVTVDFQKKMTSAGSCPSSFSFGSSRVGSHSVSYQPFCDFAEKIKTFILAMSALSALYIISSSVRKA